ncbi:MAG: type II secretion system protein J [Oscillospiraceae bacterium]
MNNKKIKGFTLVECLIALAILGIGSLIMAQIYANVSRINLSNHNVNTSLSYQMKVVEEATGADSISMYFGGGTTSTPDPNAADSSTTKYPPHKQGISDLTKPNIKIVGSYGSHTYSYPVDIYVLLSRDANDKASDDSDYSGADEKDYALRYKYIVGHSN